MIYKTFYKMLISSWEKDNSFKKLKEGHPIKFRRYETLLPATITFEEIYNDFKNERKLTHGNDDMRNKFNRQMLKRRRDDIELMKNASLTMSML